MDVDQIIKGLREHADQSGEYPTDFDPALMRHAADWIEKTLAAVSPEERRKKEVAKGALLHGMLQLRICTQVTGRGGVADMEKAKKLAAEAEEWVEKRLTDYGLTWDDVRADFREFYKDQIPSLPQKESR